jgi:hypothetical protein
MAGLSNALAGGANGLQYAPFDEEAARRAIAAKIARYGGYNPEVYAEPQQNIPPMGQPQTLQDTLQTWALQNAKGQGPAVNYADYGGPNKPLSQMGHQDLMAATRNMQPNVAQMDPGMQAIDNTRRYIGEQQAMAGMPTMQRDSYREAKVPNQVAQQEAIRSSLMSRLMNANSMSARLEIMKQLAQNEGLF